MSENPCQRFREQIEDVLYGESPEAEAVERHLAECAACREELAAMRRALVAVDRAGLDAAPEGVAEAVAVGVAARLGRPRRRTWLRVAASVAASLVIALGVWLVARPGGGDPAGANAALAVEAQAVAADAETVLRLVDELERENAALLRLLGAGGPPVPGGDRGKGEQS